MELKNETMAIIRIEMGVVLNETLKLMEDTHVPNHLLVLLQSELPPAEIPKNQAMKTEMMVIQ
jgi:hypothetical protein